MNKLRSILSVRSLSSPFLFAVRTIKRHKTRTALALLGVVIGVFSVVVVNVLGEAVKNFVVKEVESFGTDVIQVEVKVPSTGKMSSDNAFAQAQGTQITTLTLDDRDAIAKLGNVEAAYAGSIGQERAEYGGVGKRIMLFGAGPDVMRVDQNLKLAEGRFFNAEENESAESVVVLGSGIKETLFGRQNALGESISMRGQKYRVVGVFESRGSAGFIDLDSITYIPIETLQKKILGVRHVQMISVKMRDTSKEAETTADIIALMRKRHNIDDPTKDDFAVTSVTEAKEALTTVLDSLSILLLALTSISLVVGGVGIMNVMYVSVAERTSEIGLRKALGATSGNILRQFLFEALIITGLGGLFGILLGALFAVGAALVFSAIGFGLSIVFTPSSLLLGAVFSMAVGLLFGIAPAYRAAELSPMEALRRE